MGMNPQQVQQPGGMMGNMYGGMPNMGMQQVRPKKIIPLFPVALPTLIFWCRP